VADRQARHPLDRLAATGAPARGGRQSRGPAWSRRLALVLVLAVAAFAGTTVQTQDRAHALVPAVGAAIGVTAAAARVMGTAATTQAGRATMAGAAWGAAQWLGENVVAPILVDLVVDRLTNADQATPTGTHVSGGDQTFRVTTASGTADVRFTMGDWPDRTVSSCINAVGSPTNTTWLSDRNPCPYTSSTTGVNMPTWRITGQTGAVRPRYVRAADNSVVASGSVTSSTGWTYYLEATNLVYVQFTDNANNLCATCPTVYLQGTPLAKPDPLRDGVWNITCGNADGTGGYVKSAPAPFRESQLGGGDNKPSDATWQGSRGWGGGWSRGSGGWGNDAGWFGETAYGSGGWGAAPDGRSHGGGTFATPRLTCDPGDQALCIGPLMVGTVTYVPQYCYPSPAESGMPATCTGPGSCLMVWAGDDACVVQDADTGEQLSTLPVADCRDMAYPNGQAGGFPGCDALDPTRRVEVGPDGLCRLVPTGPTGPENDEGVGGGGAVESGDGCLASWDVKPNPVTWVDVPVRCALRWAFRPDDETLDRLYALDDDLAGKVPFGYVEQATAAAGDSADAAAGACWDGLDVQLDLDDGDDGYAGRVLDLCPGSDLRDGLDPLRGALTFGLWLGVLVPLGMWAFRQSVPVIGGGSS
jgi:hypothetical protein